MFEFSKYNQELWAALAKRAPSLMGGLSGRGNVKFTLNPAWIDIPGEEVNPALAGLKLGVALTVVVKPKK